MRPSRVPAVLVMALAGGCGTAGSDTQPQVDVSVGAAASLQAPLAACARSIPGVRLRLEFAGSDQIAAQIRQGVRPDVFAAANTALPDALHAEGLADMPVVFATNELVLAVPRGEDAIASIGDLTRGHPTLAIGSASVPVGDYTHKVLARVPLHQRTAILANVRSSEPDVKGIVGKLGAHAVDAGFVYRSDVTAARGALRAIELPTRLRPAVRYGAAVVRGTRDGSSARRVLADLLGGSCATALRRAGFGAP